MTTTNNLIEFNEGATRYHDNLNICKANAIRIYKERDTNGNGTNWVDAITQSAPVSSVNFSIANGEKNGKYYLSAGYLKRDGIIQQTGFERGNVKMNSEFKLGNKLKVGEHINVAFTNTKLGLHLLKDNLLPISNPSDLKVGKTYL